MADWKNEVHVASERDGNPVSVAAIENRDHSQDVPGMPPNWGHEMLPHAVTFQGIMSTVSRVYRPSDEALKHSIENARYMLNDPSVMECVEQRKRSTVLLDWDLEPEDPDDPEHQGLAATMKDILQDTPRFMQYRENLLHALWYGRYAVQNSFGWKKIKGHWRYVIQKWVPVHGDKLVFRFDDGSGQTDDEQVGVRIGAGIRADRAFSNVWTDERMNKIQPTDWGLAYFLDEWEKPLLPIHKHLIEDGEYENPHDAGKIHGVGIRSRIYWVWYQRQEALAWLMEFLERSAFGVEMWYYPQGNPNAKAEMIEAAKTRIGQGRNMIFIPKPMGEEGLNYGVERIEPAMGGADVLKEILTDYFGHQIKRYILGQTLTSEADATGMGSNLASVHLDTYLQIVKYDATNLEETMTKEVVEPLKNLNFPSYADVPLRFKILTEAQDVEGRLAAWKNAFDMGLKLAPNDVYELVGASIPEPGEEVLDANAQQDQGGLGGLFGGGGFPGNEPAPVNDPESRDGATGTEVADLETTSEAMAEPYQAERYAEWKEEDHPRADDGKFGEGGGADKKTEQTPTPKKKEPWEMSSDEFGAMMQGYHVTASTENIRKEGFRTGKGGGVGGDTDKVYTSTDREYSEGLADHLNNVMDVLHNNEPISSALEYARMPKEAIAEGGPLAGLIRLYGKRQGRELTDTEKAAVIAFNGPGMKYPETPPKFGDELASMLAGGKYEVLGTRGRDYIGQSEIMGGERSHRTGDVWHDDHRKHIEQALQQGKPVPPEVLADYPDLQSQRHQSPHPRERYRGESQWDKHGHRWVTINGAHVMVNRKGSILAGREEISEAKERSGGKKRRKPEPRIPAKQKVQEVATDWGVDQGDLLDYAKEITSYRHAIARDREDAKSHLREMTGLTAQDVSRIANDGKDYTSANIGGETGRRLKKFDVWADAINKDHPGILDVAGRSGDVAGAAWDLLAEGKGRTPQYWDDDILQEAATRIDKESGSFSGDVDDSFDPSMFEEFKRAGTPEKYDKWITIGGSEEDGKKQKRLKPPPKNPDNIK
jgi:hypothetical protein